MGIAEVHKIRIPSVLDLFEIVHVQLSHRATYLPDEALQGILLEDHGEHVVDELSCVLYHDGQVVAVPAHCFFVGLVLRGAIAYI